MKFDFKVGQKYRLENNSLLEITNVSGAGVFPIWGRALTSTSTSSSRVGDIYTYTKNGKYYAGGMYDPMNIVSLVEDVITQRSDDDNYQKVYILVRENVPNGFVANSCAHIGVKIENTWNNDPKYVDWRENSFRKVTCIAKDDELLDIIGMADTVGVKHITFNEPDFNNKTIVVAFSPVDTTKEEFAFFKKLSLYK